MCIYVYNVNIMMYHITFVLGYLIGYAIVVPSPSSNL